MQDTLERAVEKLKEAMEEEFPDSFKEHRGLQRALKIIEESNRVIETGTERVTGIVGSLRNFARMDQAEQKEMDIHQGLEDTLMLVHHNIKNHIEVIRNYGSVPPLLCYPGRLNQVFLNVINNAQQAIEGKGTITVATKVRGEELLVSVADTEGSGISEENLEKLFDPTFTTKPAGAGTGLGLSISQQIVEEHGGRIEVESKEGEGTTFRVILPLNPCG